MLRVPSGEIDDSKDDEMKGFPDMPPIWWAGSVAIIYLGKWLVPAVHFTSSILSGISWLMLIAAIGIIVWSGLWFLRKKTPIEPHHTPKVLIVEGPYRLSRNPIYVALVMLTIASALGHGSVLGLVAAAGLWWILDRRFAAPEEALLHTTFGAEAESYLNETKRWL
jgi:protein-S-isoprenylcysteine O-methyltransferase Ste14